MRFRERLAVVVAAVLLASPLAAGQTVFRSEVGILVYPVRADSMAAFEEVLAKLREALGRDAETMTLLPASLKMFRNSRGASDGWEQYVVVVEQPRPGLDYSIDGLIRRVLPEEAGGLLGQLTAATGGVAPAIQDLSLVGSVTPADALNLRLDGFLRGELTSARHAGETPEAIAGQARTMERLQQAIWSVDALDVQVVEKTASYWEFEWRFALRNLSLTEALNADVAVEFRDADGTLLEAARSFEMVPLQESRVVSGRRRIAIGAALRVANTSIAVERR